MFFFFKRIGSVAAPWDSLRYQDARAMFPVKSLFQPRVQEEIQKEVAGGAPHFRNKQKKLRSSMFNILGLNIFLDPNIPIGLWLCYLL